MKRSTFTIMLALLFIVNSMAQQVENVQRTLITKRTASWCPYCGTWGWTLMENLISDNDGKAVLIAAHYDGILAVPASSEITSNFTAFSQPVFYVNSTNQMAQSGNIATIRTSVKSQVDAAFGTLPTANVGFEPYYENGQIKVDAKVKFFKPGDGEYYLGVYLLESNFTAYQASLGNNANHKKVLRFSFTDSTWGHQLADGTVAVNSEFTENYALNIGDPMGYDYEVVGIIWQKINGKYQVVNVWSTNNIAMTSGTDELAGISEFNITPSVTNSNAKIQLELIDNQQDVSLDILDINGRLLHNIYNGALGNGAHQFDISKENTGAAGVYFVRLSTGGEVLTKKVVFQ